MSPAGPDEPRCAPASAARGEPLHGTASTVRAFLLVQQEGAWGRDALTDSALPAAVAAWLADGARRHGVRPLLIRRHGRADPGVQVFAARADVGGPWLEAGVLDDLGEVTDLDLAALGRGGSVGLARTSEPLFLACTHGSHDACCAVEGRTVAAGLAEAHPDRSWEVSHVGGDRFAGNLLVLPHGLYYGRVDATSGPAIADAHLAGRLDLDHLRGRSGLAFPVQAAEHHLRRHLDLDGIDDVEPTGHRSEDGRVIADFATPVGAFRVEVVLHRGPAERLTCHAAQTNRPLVVRLVDLRPT